jgi:hypothetical protein
VTSLAQKTLFSAQKSYGELSKLATPAPQRILVFILMGLFDPEKAFETEICPF